jgi:hypothetical protein
LQDEAEKIIKNAGLTHYPTLVPSKKADNPPFLLPGDFRLPQA